MLKCFDLTGEVAIVTGAAKGLGRVFAKALAKSGAHVYLLGHGEGGMKEVEKEIIELGVQCIWRYADITNQKDVEESVSDCIKHFGKIMKHGIRIRTPHTFYKCRYGVVMVFTFFFIVHSSLLNTILCGL